MRISDWSSDVCSSDLIDIDTLSHGEARLGDGLDAAIALARAIDPALYAARLDQDKIFPIAARDLTDGERPITVPEQLQRRSEEHTSELQSLMRISYAVFCLKKKTKPNIYSTRDKIKNNTQQKPINSKA